MSEISVEAGDTYETHEYIGYSETLQYATQTSWEYIDSYAGNNGCGAYIHPQWLVAFTDPGTTIDIDGGEVGIDIGPISAALGVSISNTSAGVTAGTLADVGSFQEDGYEHSAALYVEVVETGTLRNRVFKQPHFPHYPFIPNPTSEFEAHDLDSPFYPFTGTPEKWYTGNWQIYVTRTCCDEDA